MIKSSKSKKEFKSIVSLLLVTAILITGALAYLTATDSKTNTFTVGNVNIELTEPNWDENNGKNIVPGETIDKDPTITNTGKNDAYVYIKVSVPKKDGISVNENGVTVVKDDVQLFTYEVNDGWTLIQSNTDDADNNYYVYAYDTTLAPEGVTAPLFDDVTFANIVSGQIDSTEELEILVTGYAIQSDSIDATNAEEAWGIYATQSNWTWVEEDEPAGSQTLNFKDENGNIIHTETVVPGQPIDVYFDSSLAKDGFTFDWVDANTGDVAYSGMPMPENGVNLVPSYTETGFSAEPTEGLFYKIRYDEVNGLYAEASKPINSDEEFSLAAFNGTDVVIPSTVTVTRGQHFESVGTEGSATIKEGKTAGNFTAEFDAAGVDYEETVTIPVKALGGGLISDLDPKTLVIPDSVSIIGGYLTSNGSTPSTPVIIEEIILPYGVTNIGKTAFGYSTSLKRVYLPSSIETIGENAFTGCTALETVENLNYVKSIGNTAFMNTALVSVDISSATTLGQTAFSKSGGGSTKLAEITLAEGLEVIPQNCFARAVITEVRIPVSVTSIEKGAFNACSSLTDIYYAGTEEQWNAITIGDTNTVLANATIHFES